MALLQATLSYPSSASGRLILLCLACHLRREFFQIELLAGAGKFVRKQIPMFGIACTRPRLDVSARAVRLELAGGDHAGLGIPEAECQPRDFRIHAVAWR